MNPSEKVYTWDQVKVAFWNFAWYKWTTTRNSGGDLASWIEPREGQDPQFCRGLVRREDGLIFLKDYQCRLCAGEEERYKTRGFQVGYFFRGTDIFGTSYDGYGSHLPERKSATERHE